MRGARDRWYCPRICDVEEGELSRGSPAQRRSGFGAAGAGWDGMEVGVAGTQTICGEVGGGEGGSDGGWRAGGSRETGAGSDLSFSRAWRARWKGTPAWKATL